MIAISDEIELIDGAYSARIAPRFGASILSFKKNGDDILRPGSIEDVRADPRNAACFPCVPYFGRLIGGLSFHGSHWPLDPNLAICDPDHALHGEGWIAPWSIIDQDTRKLTCSFTHQPNQSGRFPFAFEAQQNFLLTGNGLNITLRLTNTGPVPMPAGLGLHPFFQRRDTTRLSFLADKLWTPPDQKSRGHITDLPDPLGQLRNAALPDETRDHSYLGWGGQSEIHRKLAPSKLDPIIIQSDAPFLHIYAPADESYFCLEPITHLPGQLTDTKQNTRAHALEPANSISLSMTITG